METHKVLKKLAILANRLDSVGAKAAANAVDMMMITYADALREIPLREEVSPKMEKAKVKFDERLKDLAIENIGRRLIPLVENQTIDDLDELKQIAQDYADEFINSYFEEIEIDPGPLKEDMVYTLSKDVEKWVKDNKRDDYVRLEYSAA